VYFQDEKGNMGAMRKQATIIGVVQDFHFASLHDKIKPVVFSLSENKYIKPDLMHVRISGKDVPAAVAHLKQVWARFDPENPVALSFMDEQLDRLYRAEARFLQVFSTFAGLAILIAGLGVLGLASLTTAQRTREIGIRKVLGASVGQVTMLLSKDFPLAGGPIERVGLAGGLVRHAAVAGRLCVPHPGELVGIRAGRAGGTGHCPAHGQLPIGQGGPG
jgi:hypothetical protein